MVTLFFLKFQSVAICMRNMQCYYNIYISLDERSVLKKTNYDVVAQNSLSQSIHIFSNLVQTTHKMVFVVFFFGGGGGGKGDLHPHYSRFCTREVAAQSLRQSDSSAPKIPSFNAERMHTWTRRAYVMSWNMLFSNPK